MGHVEGVRNMKNSCSQQASVEEGTLGDIDVVGRIILKWISCNECVVD